MANRENLILLRDYLWAHPEEHNQTSWARKSSCGTTRCLAGTAAFLAGKEIDWSRGAVLAGTGITVTARTTDGLWIEEVAQEWLGLDPEEANELFFRMDEYGSLEELGNLIDQS